MEFLKNQKKFNSYFDAQNLYRLIGIMNEKQRKPGEAKREEKLKINENLMLGGGEGLCVKYILPSNFKAY